MKIKQTSMAIAAVLSICTTVAEATPALDGGWKVDPSNTTVTFLSIKQQDIMELSSFKNIRGQIDETGAATVKIDLESVDTDVAVRDERIKAHLFQTDVFPVAEVTTHVNPDMLVGLEETGSATIDLTFQLDLHGVSVERETSVIATLHGDDRVEIMANEPVIFGLEEHELLPGIKALEDLAGVVINPITGVLFKISFERDR